MNKFKGTGWSVYLYMNDVKAFCLFRKAGYRGQKISGSAKGLDTPAPRVWATQSRRQTEERSQTTKPFPNTGFHI